MLEAAPGVYVGSHMTRAVREQVWRVMQGWMGFLPEDGGLVLLWSDQRAPSGLGMLLIGWPKKELVDHEGMWLSLGHLTQQHDEKELEALARRDED
jgi:CRISPR-associated protein Cas2